MTASRFYFCAIPKVIWDSNGHSNDVTFASLAADALDSERRIQKDVNLDTEYHRYTLTCQQIEQRVLSSTLLRPVSKETQFSDIVQAGQIPIQVAGAGYLALLAHAQEESKDKRLSASFYTPGQVSDHLKVFGKWLECKKIGNLGAALNRIKFLEQAEQCGCAVVEVQAPFLSIEASQAEKNWEIYRVSVSDEHDNSLIAIPDFDITGEAVSFFREKDKQLSAQQLREQIRYALENKEPITVGNQARHDVITEVLHELVFASGSENRPAVLRIAYVDGSEGEPFPIFCLPKGERTRPDNKEVLVAALMSIRHYELDERIDFCWFRNREVSQSRTLAESDSFCFKSSLSQLCLAQKKGDFDLDLYHTGFEPAVIGFYRALVKTMLDKFTSHISVQPLYFRGESGYEVGSLWAN
jgi:hypothetical protein